MVFENIATELLQRLYEQVYIRERRRIQSEVLEEKGILPNFKKFEENAKEDFQNIKEIIEKFVLKEIRVSLEIDDDIKFLQDYIDYDIKNPKLKEYLLNIKNMLESSSVDLRVLKEMLEDNLPLTLYAISFSLQRMKHVCGSYFARCDLISLNFPTIRNDTFNAIYIMKIPLSRLEKEERARVKVLEGEEISHFIGKSLIFQTYNLEEEILSKYYELGKDATILLKETNKNISSILKFSELPQVTSPFYVPVTIPLYIPTTIIEKRREEVLKLGELIKKCNHIAGLSEGLAKFIVKTAIVEKDPQLKSFYLVKLKTSEDISVQSYIDFFEECYKQIGNSILEKVNLFLPTSEEILKPSLYLQRIGK